MGGARAGVNTWWARARTSGWRLGAEANCPFTQRPRRPGPSTPRRALGPQANGTWLPAESEKMFTRAGHIGGRQVDEHSSRLRGLVFEPVTRVCTLLVARRHVVKRELTVRWPRSLPRLCHDSCGLEPVSASL